MTHDYNAMGVVRAKETHPLHRVRLEDFQDAIDWAKRRIATRGYFVLDVSLDADLQTWMFRVQDDLVIRVEHELVARAQDCLDAINGNQKQLGTPGQTWQL